MAEWLIEPLSSPLFVRALLSGIIVAISCGALSSFIVWRGMSFIGDALAHSVLPGIVLAIIIGVNMIIGALAAALISVFSIGAITSKKGLKQDSAIGVIFAGAFALGIILMTKFGSGSDLTHILFGNIIGVTSENLILILIVGIIVVFAIILFFKELLVTSFDVTHSTAIGLSPKLIHYGLLVLIAFTTVIATQTVGVVLVLALLVTPASAASMLFKKLENVVLFSIIISVVSVFIGIFSAHHLELAPGATIVLVLTIIFLIIFIFHSLSVKKK